MSRRFRLWPLCLMAIFALGPPVGLSPAADQDHDHNHKPAAVHHGHVEAGDHDHHQVDDEHTSQRDHPGGRDQEAAEAGFKNDQGGHEHDHHDGGSTVIDVPESVRSNLGITFARARLRSVKRIRRAPGQFELLPRAERRYHAFRSGRVRLKVGQFQKVEPGQLIFLLDSPEWRQNQYDLAVALSEKQTSRADVTAARAALEQARRQAGSFKERIRNLAKAKVRKVELEIELDKLRQTAAGLKARLEAQTVRRRTAALRYQALLQAAASVTGLPPRELDRSVPDPTDDQGRVPRWLTVDLLECRAEAGGIVDEVQVTDGEWVERGAKLLSTVDPDRLRFQAFAPQTDLVYYRDGQPVRIIPPREAGAETGPAEHGRLTIGFRAHASQHTISLYVIPTWKPEWARPGAAGFLEVVVAGSDEKTTAVPKACLVRDGLDYVFFKRDPHNPDKVIRTKAELGADDGRWAVVKHGLAPGDEVIRDGVYELNLIGAGEQAQGGHFHADGSFHGAKH